MPTSSSPRSTSRRSPEAVYRLAIEDRIEPVTSLPLLAELGRVLAEKFEWEPWQVEEAVAQVAETATVVNPDERVQIIREDPDDDRVL